MTQTFIEGFRIPVTKVKLGPCVITQIKTHNKDGYDSLQLGFENKNKKNTTKPLQGHFKASYKSQVASNKFPRFLKEVRLDKESEYKVGDVIKAEDIFKKGDVVNVTGIMKGKGFQGGVKRHGFHGGPKTHGQSDRHRAPGSIGQTTTPGRVYKGKRMAGRMGGVQVTIKNLHIVDINSELNEIVISGAIPGSVGGLVKVKKIKSGTLKDLEHETVAQVVEGEPEVKEEENAK